MTINELLLSERHKESGLSLKQTGLVLKLTRDGEVLHRWTAETVTVAEIVQTADSILCWDNSGISFEKVR